MASQRLPFIVGPKLTDGIDRHEWAEIGRARYIRDYVLPLKPVIIRGAFDHWPARSKWNLHFLHDRHGDLPIKIAGSPEHPDFGSAPAGGKLGAFIEQVLASTPDRPAPYLRNQPMTLWPTELQADISPMPDCTQPNWLQSRWFPSKTPLTYIEAFIGGPGTGFPYLHYDGLHTHAFLMQIEGVKEYVAFPPESPFVYPTGPGSDVSHINDVEKPDLDRYPLFAQATGFRFQLHPGETLFIPAGWWHTARILTPSITIAMNGVNAANSKAFVCDYRKRIEASQGRLNFLRIRYLQTFAMLQIFREMLQDFVWQHHSHNPSRRMPELLLLASLAS